MLDFLSIGKGTHDPIDVRLRQLIIVRDLNALVGGINEQNPAVRLALLQYHDAGGNTGPEEQIARKLNHAVHEVVANKVLPDLLFSPAAIHDAGEADNGCRAVRSQPGKGMHDKGQVCFALGSQHTCRSKSRIID